MHTYSQLGDEWLERCRDDLGKDDWLTPIICAQYPKGMRILEIGCSNGWRLQRLKDAGYQVAGLEPSPNACKEAQAAALDVRQGVAQDAAIRYGKF
jgi:SAM-dependent methyltransferase